MCLFLLLRAGPLTPATSSRDHGSPCCTDEAGKPSGLLSPEPGRHLCRVYPLSQQGARGRTRVHSFLQERTLPLPSHFHGVSFFCYYAPGLSHPQSRQVTMVHHAARMRLGRPVDVSAPGLPRHLWASLPRASARGRGADAGSLHPELYP